MRADTHQAEREMLISQPAPQIYLTGIGHEQHLVRLFADRDVFCQVLAKYCRTETSRVWVRSGKIIIPQHLVNCSKNCELILFVSADDNYNPGLVYADAVLDTLVETLPWLEEVPSVGLVILWPQIEYYESSFRQRGRFTL